MKTLRYLCGLLLFFVATNCLTAADDLEKQLLRAAPDIVTAIKAKGYQNVGTLKFRVKKGNQPPSDRVGTLNTRLAEKLELALILATKPQDPIGIIHNASSTAATIPGASHLTPEGRQKLFTAEYPLAWGKKEVTPDAFLTGVALITPDLRNMTVAITIFDKLGKELEKLTQFDVKPDLEDLLDSGESFLVRGVFDSGSLQMNEEARKEKATEEAVQTSLKVQSETAEDSKPVISKQHPLSPQNAAAPIALEVWYDNQPQQIEFRDGAAFLREPTEQQKVILVVKRKGPGAPRLGVVLKVNGISTLYKQKSPDAQCTPWILEPRLNEFGIRGYQVDKDTLEPFRVLSQAESKTKELDYGEFVGTISVSVFKEQTTTPTPAPRTDGLDDEDFAVLTRSTFPKKTPANLSAMKAQLGQIATRGLIDFGPEERSGIDIAPFTADPLPIMSGTIRYYQPQDLPK
jgi:hypothetical protein